MQCPQTQTTTPPPPQAGPGVQILAKVHARPCAAARATVEGVYDQQQRDNTGGWVSGRCVCQFYLIVIVSVLLIGFKHPQ